MFVASMKIFLGETRDEKRIGNRRPRGASGYRTYSPLAPIPARCLRLLIEPNETADCTVSSRPADALGLEFSCPSDMNER